MANPVTRHIEPLLPAAVAAADTPPAAVVVPLVEDRGRRFPTPVPVSISGALAGLAPAAVLPPPASVVPLYDERGRRLPAMSAMAAHGFVDSGVGVPGTTPPPPSNVDRADQRVRYRPLDPVALNGLLAALASAPTVPPPVGPFVVPVEERRRFLAALPPTVTHGFDDPAPPEPQVIEPDDRRRRYKLPGDPISISGALLFTVPFVMPPRPVVVFSDERSLRRVPQPMAFAGPGFVVVAINTLFFDPPDPLGRATGDPRLGTFDAPDPVLK